MKVEEASNLLGDMTLLIIEALRTKYGDRILQDICVRMPLYPAAGVALLLGHAGPPKCDELIPMIKGSISRAPSSINMGPFTINCQDDAAKFTNEIMKRVERICKEKGSEEALKYLAHEALKIPYLDELENGVLLNSLAFVPQILVYASHNNVDVTQDVIQAHTHMAQFISKVLTELREELKRCRGR
ncbi:hypothetical protein IPA_00040 [Ignicoccus pacificus DSM 13166]|uniref:Uncharacterized protein n=1 Tax=Ignicoccus pacificus DSM 13166 TaxID=940294 RepID=A0A977PL47_9CREN|nr:hypothetical protein IPA_00040 [Ignicoccus pacificus DSM 13166]